ncbi:MAG: hypothetical protein COB22_08670 [Cycloclasticus sp.]|nr:MAG: hypothetical protein COB22_08670 [Cycloclasticus sp.]
MKMAKLMKEIRAIHNNDSETARRLGISRQSVFNISDGTNIPKDETIVAMAKELKLDEAKLMIQAKVQRSRGHSKEVWEKIAKKYESVAASILLLPALPLIFDAINVYYVK